MTDKYTKTVLSIADKNQDAWQQARAAAARMRIVSEEPPTQRVKMHAGKVVGMVDIPLSEQAQMRRDAIAHNEAETRAAVAKVTGIVQTNQEFSEYYSRAAGGFTPEAEQVARRAQPVGPQSQPWRASDLVMMVAGGLLVVLVAFIVAVM